MRRIFATITLCFLFTACGSADLKEKKSTMTHEQWEVPEDQVNKGNKSNVDQYRRIRVKPLPDREYVGKRFD